jgi:hypothetical protein
MDKTSVSLALTHHRRKWVEEKSFVIDPPISVKPGYGMGEKSPPTQQRKRLDRRESASPPVLSI